MYYIGMWIPLAQISLENEKGKSRQYIFELARAKHRLRAVPGLA